MDAMDGIDAENDYTANQAKRKGDAWNGNCLMGTGARGLMRLRLVRFFAGKFADARLAGTDLAEMAEAVNPRGVTVGKLNLNCVIPHRCRSARGDLRLE